MPAVRWVRSVVGNPSDERNRGSVLLPTEDFAALSQRVGESFLGGCVRRFLTMNGIDRSLVLASQAFTALIPLLILVSTLLPAGSTHVVSQTIVRKFGLSGDSATAVHRLFETPEVATSSLSVFSALLLVFSGISYTRRLQATYLAAWDRPKPGGRGALSAALGLFALLAEVLALYTIQGLFAHLPFAWLLAVPLSAATGLLLWTSIPYLLMDRQVHWRRLLVGGGVTAIATALYGVATTVYMPSLVARYTSEFGLFGITIAIVGWLLAISVVLVASASIGAEFDRSRAHWALVTKQRFGLVDPALEPLTPLGPDEVSGLSGSDVLLLMRVLVNWLVIAAAVWVAAAIVPGIEVRGGFGTLLWVSLLLGLVNAVLGPLLWFVAMPLSVLTVGLSALVVNGALLAVTAGLSDNLDVGGFGGTVLGALLISGVTTLLELVLRPISRLGLSRPAGASGAAGRGRDGS